MEQALIRLGRFVNDIEGNGRGDDYIKLAKFLLDNRGGGNEYDQSHLPVQKQYEAVGHAVRAIYCYSGMADVAIETRDVDYQSAVMSLWNNIVNKNTMLPVALVVVKLRKDSVRIIPSLIGHIVNHVRVVVSFSFNIK